MINKPSSTGKSKVKRTQLIRMSECSTCPKVSQSCVYKKDFERPQPIKIAQLLGQSENLKSAQKDTARKRIQPERLGSFSNIKSTKKSNKKNGVDSYNHNVNVLKCVRRNLNFNDFSTNSSKENYDSKNQPHKIINADPIHKKCSNSVRKSLLLPPNTIKEKYLQNRTEKVSRYSKISEIPNKTLLDKTETVQKEHEKLEVVDALPLNDKSTNINNSIISFDSIKPSPGCKIIKSSEHQNSKHVTTSHIQSNIISKSRISSQHITNNEIIKNNENQSLTQNGLPKKRFTSSKINLKNEAATKLQDERKYVQSLCNNLQSTKLVDFENDMNTKSASSEMICINKDKIMSLECDLKNLICVTEENVFKLKSLLTCVTKLLSENNVKIDTDVEKKHFELEKVNNIMIDKEVQVDTCYNLLQQTERNFMTLITHTPQVTVTNILSLNESRSNENFEDEKENHELIHRRRLSDGDGSFLELENQFNIKHPQPAQNSISLQKTPVITRYKQKRSLREYMALKETMKFLETPNGKKFKMPMREMDNMNNSVLNATYISNKLLTDLHNLYSESPESSL